MSACSVMGHEYEVRKHEQGIPCPHRPIIIENNQEAARFNVPTDV